MSWTKGTLVALVVAAVTYILFFAPAKKLAPIDTPLPASPEKPVAIVQPAGPAPPVPPATSGRVTMSALPLFQAWMSNSENSGIRPATVASFFPNEKVYLHVIFPELAAGAARVNVNWISPAGKQTSSAEQVISQATSGPASILFWLSIFPNGAVTALFTGKEYKPQVYGQWQAQVFFNGEPLAKLPFHVRDY